MQDRPAFSIAEFLFDDRGRMGRAGFWRFCLFGVGIAVVVLFAVGVRRMLLAHTIFGILMIYPCYCVFAKRLQDLDVHGAWAVLIVGISAVDIVSGLIGFGTRPGWAATASRIWTYVSNFNFLIVLTMLGALPGSQAKNRFGPVPDL